MRYLKLLPAALAVSLMSAGLSQAQNMTVTPYGFLKFDLAYDQARTAPGDYALYVLPDSEKDNQMSITARQTRLGARFAVKAPIVVSGRFESDFYNGLVTTADNKSTIMMRHAFVRVDFSGWYLLAGQTSDVISPLVPTTVNYTVLWDQGNIGYRMPQLQFGNTGSPFQVIGALSRNVPANDVDGNKIDDGADSGVPTVQASASWTTARGTLGVSGHYGVMEYRDIAGKKENYHTTSINLSARCQATPALLLQGEAFSGRNLAQFFGGIGQDFDNRLQDVETVGGWANATVTCANGLQYTLGAGIDDPDEDAASAFPSRTFNSDYYVNLYVPVAANTQFAAEVSYLTTKFFNAFGAEDDISGVRLQTAFIMNF